VRVLYEEGEVNVFTGHTLTSCSIHVKAALAAASCVARHAKAASAPAASALPPLNPYQPTHNIPVPSTVSTTLQGPAHDAQNIKRPRGLANVMKRTF